MKRNSRLSAVLHALLHMAERGAPMTSDELAVCLQTNPVVVRRTMAGLRDVGLVTSGRGHGGGWALARPLEAVTMRDIYSALGEPMLFQMGNATESPGCLVEQAVNHALDDAFRDAEAMLIARLGEVTLAMLAQDFKRRFAEHRALYQNKG
ncbi:RrF2 family transcriptional regulator [Pararhizobium antarcticum]|uniref:Transcriptional regulator n=1 Tax=Pararhizobium antarcticum TaxID=1798805 RepID=A0A657LYK9_9HYPH|nr:Rrf2 family transcriptional regulator [Pararhizobium antarcticum]OJG00263.1 transcriptional regulator [Pararhizobium antarcticum]OJG00894.1 transcriptional regulator [Rhizobium sp. 58]